MVRDLPTGTATNGGSEYLFLFSQPAHPDESGVINSKVLDTKRWKPKMLGWGNHLVQRQVGGAVMLSLDVDSTIQSSLLHGVRESYALVL